MELSLSREHPLYEQVEAYLTCEYGEVDDKFRVLMNDVVESDLETALELLTEPELQYDMYFIVDFMIRALNNKADSWKQFPFAYELGRKYGSLAEQAVGEHIIEKCNTVADYMAAGSIFRKYGNEFMLKQMKEDLTKYIDYSSLVN